jgi:protein-disulfide isomerase
MLHHRLFQFALYCMRSLRNLALILCVAPFTAFAAEPYPDLIMGPESAPVTLVEYSSITCPHCAHFQKYILPELEKKYVETGKLRLVHRDFVMDQQGLAGITLARCNNDRYPAFLKILFDKQDNWAFQRNYLELLTAMGKLGGISQETYEKCRNNAFIKDRIVATTLAATQTYSIKAVPTLVINGTQYEGRLTFQDLSEAIDKILAPAAPTPSPQPVKAVKK